MATDSTDPRIGLIVRIGVLSIVTLIAVHAGLVSYFDRMAQAETYKKVGSLKPEALLSLRAEEQQRLTSGSLPIDKSMQLLTTKGRMGLGADVSPVVSKDLAPLQGWAQMPATVPAAMEAAASAAAAPSAAPSASSVPSSAPAPRAPRPAGGNPPKHP